MYWFGWTPDMCVADVEVAKQVLSDRTGLFPKNVTTPMLLKLFGRGLVLANGDEWQRHKKVVHPAFNTDKLKVHYITSHIAFFLLTQDAMACSKLKNCLV